MTQYRSENPTDDSARKTPQAREGSVERMSEDLFNVLVANELQRAHTLASRMFDDYRAAAATVHTAFSRARRQFSSYDGNISPMVWMLRHVADELQVKSLFRNQTFPLTSGDAGRALATLPAGRRLAVILRDVLGLAQSDAAAIARIDETTLRRRIHAGRSQLIECLAPALSSAP